MEALLCRSMRYREFKRVVAINQRLYNAEPEPGRHARVACVPVARPRRALDFLDVTTLQGPDALDKIWAVLDAHL
jgi:hypothetical protein